MNLDQALRLPPNEIAEICAMGCRYFHIIWDEIIDENWLEQNPDKDVADVGHEVKEFFVKEIRHDGSISKYVNLDKGCAGEPLADRGSTRT